LIVNGMREYREKPLGWAGSLDLAQG
jgi:hypothetical protein